MLRQRGGLGGLSVFGGQLAVEDRFRHLGRELVVEIHLGLFGFLVPQVGDGLFKSVSDGHFNEAKWDDFTP